MTRLYAAFAALSVLASVGCAQDVGDIDRTQPNRIHKQDLLQSDWFLAQTVVEVPTTDYFSFIGETGMLERIRWDIQENYLIAYRAYPRIPNSDPDEQAAIDSDEPWSYTENPVAAYPIVSHFDIQRDYNASTGEQGNTISENSYDRPWYERDYIRVDWSHNLITNFEFISNTLYVNNLDYFVTEEQGGPDAMVRELDEDGWLSYFDFVSKVHVEPDIWGCLYQWYGWWPGDCTSGEIKIRNSFMRAEEIREYEPFQYDDRLMTKFGYFRTERFGWDRWRSIRQTNRSYLPNRHSIWKEVWEKDEEGNYYVDEDDRLVPIPMADREPKPIVYHVSTTMPDELWDASVETAAGWDRAFRRAVAAAQDKDPDDVPTMFVLCRNPVTAEDAPECGEEGTEVRIGDIRYNHMYLVDRFTQAGLLGYGPSGADPLTGETVFGSAYVYGTEVDSYAAWATDLVRLINGDLTEDDIVMPDYIRDEIASRLASDNSRPYGARTARSARLQNTPVPEEPSRLLDARKRSKLAAIKRHGLEPLAYDRDARVMSLIKQHGLDSLMMNKEIEIGATRGKHGPQNPAPQAVADRIAPSNWASPGQMNRRKQALMEAAKRNIYLRDFADDAIVGLAKSYAGETDYEKIREEIRAAVYKAVMEHEVGHTLGLRHNFQGSYDSLNYKDEYWELRKENLQRGSNIDQLYEMAQPTQAQIDGRMHEYQYSSIMDYGMRFNSDIQGLGKYDEAAIIFGYTSGTYDFEIGPEPGFVEVYANPGNAKSLLKVYEDPDSLAFPNLLEEYHYTTVAQAFDDVSNIADRTLMKYGDLKAEREEDPSGAPVEVSYMFCSDEWVGALVSCQVFDSGADPFEIVNHYVNNYYDYYTLNHWHRDRIFWWSEDVLYAMYDRYFSPLTNVYQNWVFAYFYGTSDSRMDNYYLFAGTSAFNLLADVLLTPPSGSYYLDERGVYRNYYWEEDPEADLYVPRGVGRPQYTEYQWDSGYYYYDRAGEVGHFWDFLAAMFAITDSETYRLGVDSAADELAYSIPWYLFFEFEILDVMNSIYARDPSIAGPYVMGGDVVRPPVSQLVLDDGNGGELYIDPFTGAEVPPRPAAATQISLDTTFTQELYVALYGMAFFTSNYSLSFPDNFQVFRLGAGESLEAGPDYEVISFTDPNSGHQYAALSPISGEYDTGASLLVKQGQAAVEVYTTTQDDEERDNAYYEIVELVERINLLRSLYDIFGWTFY